MVGPYKVWSVCNAEDQMNCEGELRLSVHGWFCGWHTAVLNRRALERSK